MKQERILAASAGGGTAAGIILLLRFPPAQSAFYPRCPVYVYLHLLCPGCGAARAFAALLRGHVDEALHFNALFSVLLPFLAGYAALCWYRTWTAGEFRWPTPPQWVIQLGLALALVFAISRNLVS